MSEREQIPEVERESFLRATSRGHDDRRSQRNPADSPVPNSPEPEEDALREGEEKLARLKPY